MTYLVSNSTESNADRQKRPIGHYIGDQQEDRRKIAPLLVENGGTDNTTLAMPGVILKHTMLLCAFP